MEHSYRIFSAASADRNILGPAPIYYHINANRLGMLQPFKKTIVLNRYDETNKGGAVYVLFINLGVLLLQKKSLLGTSSSPLQ